MTISDALDVLSEFGVSVPREKIDFSCPMIIELSYEDLFGDAYGPAETSRPLVFIKFHWPGGYGQFHGESTDCLAVEAIVYNKPATCDTAFIKQCVLGKRTAPFGSRGAADVKPSKYMILTTRDFRKNLAVLKSLVKLRNSFIAKCADMKSYQQYKENCERIKKLKAENNAMLKKAFQQYDKKRQLICEWAQNENEYCEHKPIVVKYI